MSFGWAGAAAGGQDALQEMLARKRTIYLQQQAEAERQATAARADRSLQIQEQQQADSHAKSIVPPPVKRTVITTLGPKGEPIDKGFTDDELSAGVPKWTAPPPKPAPHVITTIGPRGEPIQKSVSDDELAAGVPGYREPKAPPAEKAKIWVTRGGMPTYIDPSQVQAGDGPYQPKGQKTPTGVDRQAFAYYNRAKNAVETIEGGDPGQDMETQIAHQGLLDQGRTLLAPNVLQSQLGQSYRQAQRAFTEARLRKESGAAINDAEYQKDARTYFAQPGDTPETIAQKKAARQQVLEGLAFASGPAYEEYYGEAFKGSNHATVNPSANGADHVSGAAHPKVQEWVRDATGKLVPK